MTTINVILPDGSKRELNAGATIADLAASIGVGLAKAAIAGKIDGKAVDLSAVLTDGCHVEIITEKSPEALEIIRHSASHLMAQAVKELFPRAKVTIGPAIETGFYYDFDVDTPFSPEDLERIEKKMTELAAADQKITRSEMSSADAIAMFEAMGESYKTELITDLRAETVSVYTQGGFADLCRGPHLPSTSRIKAFKLLSIAGAYWHGDEKNRMLQRIYGTAFVDKKELEAYLHRLEEAKRRDHRKLGKELDLFSFSDEVGAGLVIWHPKGAMLRTILEDFERREHLKRGYDIVLGPQILKTELWQRSGHYDNYLENMYFTEVDEQSYGVKPMNCLSHMMIYKSQLRSYRDLPLRFFELGTVHRHERAGVLHGLLRVRGFTQDDAHILCMPEQLDAEIKGVLKFVSDVMAIFGFDYEMELSTRPEKSIGDDAAWELATNALLSALKDTGRPYDINEGDGAFYGPKIDIKLKDALDRRWQCATIQCDFTLPERFDLTYVGADGEKKRPVMVHRVILGAIERFVGVLIEHYAGNFPLWLAPVQAMIVTVTDNHVPYAKEVLSELREVGVRVQADIRNEKLSFKIREAQMQKIPYMLVIGDKEVETRTVTPRFRDGKNLDALSPADFVSFVMQECRQHKVAQNFKRYKPLSPGGAVIAKPTVNINNAIRAAEVRVIGADGEQLGVIPTSKALELAEQQQLDLVEVSPTAVPLVCRIMDYGKFKYQQSKRQQEAKKKQVHVEVKEIKLRPKTDEHDLQFKIKHARRFIEEGNKVKVTLVFRGREITHMDIGRAVIQRFAAELEDIAVIESLPRVDGRNMFMMAGPKSKK